MPTMTPATAASALLAASCVAATKVARGKTASTLAAALDVMVPVAGWTWLPVCVWCAMDLDPHDKVPAVRATGDCSRCSYVGADLLVMTLPAAA